MVCNMLDRPTREQLPFYNRFIRLVDSEAFNLDIESLRTSDVDILKSTYENIEEFDDGSVNADEIPSPLHQVMMKHNLPLVMEDFIHHYVTRNEIDLDQLRNGVYIVDHKTMEASGSDDDTLNYHGYINDATHNKYIEVTLAIPVHATTTQINDTITQYKRFIKSRQTEANNNTPVGRVRSEYYALRDREIMKLYDEGLPPREILWKLPSKWRGTLNPVSISRIIYRRKQQRQNLPS